MSLFIPNSLFSHSGSHIVSKFLVVRLSKFVYVTRCVTSVCIHVV